MATPSTLGSFTPPGPGTWEQDSTHSPRPATAWKQETFREPFIRGFREGTARYGVLLDYLNLVVVNGFIYFQPAMVDFSDGAGMARRFDAARNAFEKKIWREDLERWDRDYKPDSILRNRGLESVPMQSLDTEAFIAHLRAVRENAEEMVYRHHIFTVASVIPVGNYLANASEWTGIETGRLLAPMQGCSRVSLGAHDELMRVGKALQEAGLEPSSFKEMSAAETLVALTGRRDEVGAAVHAYLGEVGMRLAGGYDVADACAIELPEMLLGAIWASRGGGERPVDEAAAAKIRDAVPAANRQAFDELLADAKHMSRLRDERGVYNDIWSTGIARQAFLECGRRLVAAGKLDDAELAVEAGHDELYGLLRGASEPSCVTLRKRREFRLNAPLSEVPPFLGPAPTPPPPMDGLPPHVLMAMRALGTAIGEVFGAAPLLEGTIICGKPVSPGVYVGPARLVLESSDMNRLVRGDVLVTASTSPAFNLVLPLLGAIVTDRGGQLSHAAIVAREYGIPAVVGTHRATSVIKDGARVEVDGTSGKIKVL